MNELKHADNIIIELSDGESEIHAPVKDIKIEHDFDSDDTHTATIRVAVEGTFQKGVTYDD